jgi:hypothetical protein
MQLLHHGSRQLLAQFASLLTAEPFGAILDRIEPGDQMQRRPHVRLI